MTYTPIIQPSDLDNIIYAEKITAITRGNSSIVTNCINTALSEVKSFLSNYDMTAMFGDPVANTAATFSDEFLNMLCIKVAAWHVVQIANVGIDLTVIRTGYEDAISILKRIQHQDQIPVNWPLATVSAAVLATSTVVYKGRRKRSNSF